ncbi:MAG: (E)-4-hydroxy-3-methylbut-2-enyl-diphosphate synthase, partial [Bacteroidales bacterium]|nr:(E)-4-hydroxy-3-methylbut-2-enyl-diphosphate synthase [Bacteroidales bacterium]
MSENRSYSSDYFSYSRLKTRAVQVGNLRIGENARITIQSMTNTNSLDTEATVAQCIRIFDAGADLVRISVQGIAEAENLKNIKQQLLEKGYTKPISADVHFNPKIAEVAAKYVEKVRINPGNYAEIMNQIDDSDEQYLEALHKISRKLKTLVQICKKHQTSIRIGVNHGSLSKRILSRYGDTPEGMVESALEFVRIFEQADFQDLIISLKSSNVLTMVYANRLLASRMRESGKVYPMHLGVTEAGNGLDGRQKSIAGIASLLQDGIGDTVRVSLTEAPEHEISVVKELLKWIPKTITNHAETKSAWFSPFSY